MHHTHQEKHTNTQINLKNSSPTKMKDTPHPIVMNHKHTNSNSIVYILWEKEKHIPLIFKLMINETLLLLLLLVLFKTLKAYEHHRIFNVFACCSVITHCDLSKQEVWHSKDNKCLLHCSRYHYLCVCYTILVCIADTLLGFLYTQL